MSAAAFGVKYADGVFRGMVCCSGSLEKEREWTRIEDEMNRVVLRRRCERLRFFLPMTL